MAVGKQLLSPRLGRVLEDLAERMVPSGGPDNPGAREFNLPDKVIAMFQAFSGGIPALRAVLWAWELLPLLCFKFRTFSGLAPEAQVKFLEGWEKSRISLRRVALTGLKAVVVAPFYGDPEVQKRIGFADGCRQPLEKIVPPWSPEETGR
jgi:hypothetical protein